MKAWFMFWWPFCLAMLVFSVITFGILDRCYGITSHGKIMRNHELQNAQCHAECMMRWETTGSVHGRDCVCDMSRRYIPLRKIEKP